MFGPMPGASAPPFPLLVPPPYPFPKSEVGPMPPMNGGNPYFGFPFINNAAAANLQAAGFFPTPTPGYPFANGQGVKQESNKGQSTTENCGSNVRDSTKVTNVETVETAIRVASVKSEKSRASNSPPINIEDDRSGSPAEVGPIDTTCHWFECEQNFATQLELVTVSEFFIF